MQNYENDIKNIIKLCLNFEPEERPSMKKIKEDLLKLYSKVCNEKSIIEHYNQIRLNRIKNYDKNNKVIKINKNENNNEKIIFPKFRVNRKNTYFMENIKNDKKNKEFFNNNLNNSISLFKDKILNRIIEDNIKLKQNILIKKSIIQNDFNININKIK